MTDNTERQWRSTKDDTPTDADADAEGNVLMKLPNGNAARCAVAVASQVEDGLWMKTDEWVEETPAPMDREATDAKVAEIQMAMENLFTGLKELGVALGWKERK